MTLSALIFFAGLLALLGACAGLLAGLFGIGGGIVLVPGLYYLFTHIGYEAHAMHLAVGTSLATIIFTGSASAWTHYKKGAVDLTIFKHFAIGVIVGVLAGSVLAKYLAVEGLALVFAGAQIIFGSYMVFNQKRSAIFSALPRQPWTSLLAALNACLATLMGVGGGVQNVLVMTLCAVPIHRAVATAALLGVLVALWGSAGFITIGWDIPDRPPLSLGYLNLPAFAAIIFTSTACAPIGAHLAHSLPVAQLKRYFSIFMIGVAIKMIFSVL